MPQPEHIEATLSLDAITQKRTRRRQTAIRRVRLCASERRISSSSRPPPRPSRPSRSSSRSSRPCAALPDSVCSFLRWTIIFTRSFTSSNGGGAVARDSSSLITCQPNWLCTGSSVSWPGCSAATASANGLTIVSSVNQPRSPPLLPEESFDFFSASLAKSAPPLQLLRDRVGRCLVVDQDVARVIFARHRRDLRVVFGLAAPRPCTGCVFEVLLQAGIDDHVQARQRQLVARPSGPSSTPAFSAASAASCMLMN